MNTVDSDGLLPGRATVFTELLVAGQREVLLRAADDGGLSKNLSDLSEFIRVDTSTARTSSGIVSRWAESDLNRAIRITAGTRASPARTIDNGGFCPVLPGGARGVPGAGRRPVLRVSHVLVRTAEPSLWCLRGWSSTR